MLRTITSLLLIPLSFFAISQKDPIIIRLGDDLINGEIIKSYTNKWKVSFVNAEGVATTNKIWTDYGQIIELDGTKYFHRVQDLYDPQMNLQDTWINMVELKTLTPVSYTSIKPDGEFTHYQFDGNKVKGSSNQNAEGETTAINVNLKEPVYDWNLYGMLLIGLPMKEGLAVKLPFYGAQTNDLNWLTARVIGQEDIRLLDDSSLNTWRVDTDKNLTFWLSEAAPYVMKLELKLQNNTKLLWEVY
jgi:hypothetical protein